LLQGDPGGVLGGIDEATACGHAGGGAQDTVGGAVAARGCASADAREGRGPMRQMASPLLMTSSVRGAAGGEVVGRCGAVDGSRVYLAGRPADALEAALVCWPTPGPALAGPVLAG